MGHRLVLFFLMVLFCRVRVVLLDRPFSAGAVFKTLLVIGRAEQQSIIISIMLCRCGIQNAACYWQG